MSRWAVRFGGVTAPLGLLGLILGLGFLPWMVGLSGCAGESYRQGLGRRIEDSRSAEAVREALGAGPNYKFDEVKVAVTNGVVELSGLVNTRAQKQRAGQLALKVQGVRLVQNKLTAATE